MKTTSTIHQHPIRTLMTILLAVGLLTACQREALAEPSSSGGTAQVDDNGGQGNDDPPGDDHGGGN